VTASELVAAMTVKSTVVLPPAPRGAPPELPVPIATFTI
jgi:hypothetical protein